MSCLKLHLGCGERRLPGWTNIDCRSSDAVDVICDIRDLTPVAKPGEVSEIYACHCLDHFSRWEYMDVLKHWVSMLEPGGIIRLSVVDFAEVVERYRETRNLRELIGLLHARQDYQSNVRHMSWDWKTLSEDLMDAGCSLVRPWKPEYVDHGSVDDYSQARLPHMAVNGRLMSLNMEGVK